MQNLTTSTGEWRPALACPCTWTLGPEEARHLPNGLGKNPHICLSPRTRRPSAPWPARRVYRAAARTTSPRGSADSGSSPTRNNASTNGLSDSMEGQVPYWWMTWRVTRYRFQGFSTNGRVQTVIIIVVEPQGLRLLPSTGRWFSFPQKRLRMTTAELCRTTQLRLKRGAGGRPRRAGPLLHVCRPRGGGCRTPARCLGCILQPFTPDSLRPGPSIF